MKWGVERRRVGGRTGAGIGRGGEKNHERKGPSIKK